MRPARKRKVSQLPPRDGIPSRNFAAPSVASLTRYSVKVGWRAGAWRRRSRWSSGNSMVRLWRAWPAVPKGCPLRWWLRASQGLMTSRKAATAAAAMDPRRDPAQRRKPATGTMSQPKAYRVRHPMPTRSPARRASPRSGPAGGGGWGWARTGVRWSMWTRVMARPRVTASRNGVERPLLLMRQNSSVLASAAAASAPVAGSKSRRPSRQVIHTARASQPRLKTVTATSAQGRCPDSSPGTASRHAAGIALNRPASRTG